ncbi:iron-siderophore ABC transporter substrate-binding protein [Grimontia sp. NTOU-MAR1]|uniref:iron-siderophore ABC transporter substrate-binding protein n=1 Tax=Grimontia sp. NTOU-MAR1 TaxID=3111011 RepID=UPI002DBACC7E|nr:iron-siderophore ABC transporter substrate-binding protein [Grimontia sp. NTOU-MAR1]WRV97926.1 iron-siderophore ABC transporter substrate-binding protein [Grimontia sp. NTOU-MAR1]
MLNFKFLLEKPNLTALVLTLITSTAVWADHKVTDSDGEKTLPAVPTRVAALNWDITEQVLELGITPIAVPDIKGYEEWVVQPSIPETSVDIGTRVEPNFTLLRDLKPDVILIASPQKDLQRRLEKIAPVLHFQTYSEDHNNAEAAIENFKRIAHLLGKDELATQKLASMKKRLKELNQQLSDAYPNGKPDVTSFRFASATSVYVYGDNSIPQFALQQLGFNNAMPQESTQWGITQKRITNLKKVGNGIALYFEPFDQQARLNRSPIWKNMPFVKRNDVAPVAASWSYGGAMSILYNAEALAEALLTLSERP